MKYFDYQLVMRAILEGALLTLELVSANIEEQPAVEEVLALVFNSDIFGAPRFY